MPGIKDLKTRIKSVKSTRKITKAMQMVSAAKMRKAQNAVLGSRTYAALAWDLIENLEGINDIIFGVSDLAFNGYLKEDSSDDGYLPLDHTLENLGKQPKKIGVILLTTNRGLVGSLNTNLMNKLKEQDFIKDNAELICEIITYGKKGKVIAAKLKKDISADFPKLDKTITTEDIYPIANYILDAFKTGKFEKIIVAYNHFVSTLVQKPSVKQILPFSSTLGAKQNADKSEFLNEEIENDIFDEPITPTTIFEPSATAIATHLIPRIIESQLYQSVLESDASEHSARMVMMKNATEAAGDLIDDYTLTYNQLRQGKITTELAEITAGKIALE